MPQSSGDAPYTPIPISTATPSIVYPHDVSSSIGPYPVSSSIIPYPVNGTTSCSSSVVSSSTPAPVYGASSSPVPVYGASSSPAPVYGASTPGYPVYEVPSSKGYESYPAPSSAKGYGGEYPPSVTSAPGKDYPSYPGTSTVKVITTTYVDSCETGVTTKTETITKTVCGGPSCKGGDSVTSVYVCNKCGPSVVTYTITKPATPATNVPSYPTAPAKPSNPSYGGDKDVPKKQEAPASSTTIEIVYVTKTPIPVVPEVKTPVAPYPSAPNGNGGYPVKPTGTGAYVPPSKPTGTGVPTKPSAYVPPAQFTGAASHVGAGMTGLLVLAAGFLLL